ncbi:hypothetical protein [uncultured Campylobacter sp.]|uniref:hypothetical protein n=1 Tax=uncultured Campylobacter sp. TaxID=218934 RepID=UPI00263485C7|nr:hypothetical protein [uncultured Campylobacter sp.]
MGNLAAARFLKFYLAGEASNLNSSLCASPVFKILFRRLRLKFQNLVTKPVPHTANTPPLANPAQPVYVPTQIVELAES